MTMVRHALEFIEDALGGTASRSEKASRFGRAKFLSGSYADAERYLRDAVETSPVHADAFLYLADGLSARVTIPWRAMRRQLTPSKATPDGRRPRRRAAASAICRCEPATPPPPRSSSLAQLPAATTPLTLDFSRRRAG